MKLSEDGALVPKHVGVGIKHEVWFNICVLFYSTWCICWLNCLACLSLCSSKIRYFVTLFNSSHPFRLDLLIYLNYIINQIFNRMSRALRTFILKIPDTALSITFKKWYILKFSSASSVGSSASSFPRTLLILLRRAVLNSYPVFVFTFFSFDQKVF
jgi:hypothetical protein